MAKQEKKRADRNRTITVSESEIPFLEHYITKAGDVDSQATTFIDRLINGDLFELIDRIPNGIADLIIIDPPYNLSKTFNASKFSAMSEERYEEYLSSWLGKVCDKLKSNGSLYLCGDWRCSSSEQRVLSKHLSILNRITWQREKGRGAQSNWKNGMEDIWFAVKNEKDYYFDVDSVKMKRQVIAPYKVDGKPKDWEDTEEGKFRITFPSNFWDDISIPFWSMPENTDHPTQKPEKLIAKLILASSKEGDLIFDPFVGSGTTCVVAKKLRRHYLGVEIDSEYCLWGAKRLMLAEQDKEIQGYNGGYFWERNTLNLQAKIKSSKVLTTETAYPETLF